MKEEKLIYKNPNDLKPDKNNPRKGFIDQEELQGMASTFKFHGLIQPIEIDERDNIICGELRWRAAKLANLKKISCKQIVGLTKEEKLERQLIENFHRQKVDLGECVGELKQLLGTVQHPKHCNKDKEPIGILAERIGVNRNWLSEVLKIDKEAPKKVKEEVQKYYETKGKKGISASAAVEIVKAPKEIQDDLVHRAKEKVPSKQLRKTRIQYQEGEKNLKEIRKFEKPLGADERTIWPLSFREKHIKDIFNGKKIQTTRFLGRRYKIGDKVEINMFQPKVGKVKIIDNVEKQLKDFTEEDAKREGGYTLKEFKKVWEKIHGEWNPESKVYAITFEVTK